MMNLTRILLAGVAVAVAGASAAAEANAPARPLKLLMIGNSFSIGEYYQALLWTAFLFKVDVTPCTYRPASVSAADADLMKRIVMDLVRADAK
jgi:hypothetical protein